MSEDRLQGFIVPPAKRKFFGEIDSVLGSNIPMDRTEALAQEERKRLGSQAPSYELIYDKRLDGLEEEIREIKKMLSLIVDRIGDISEETTITVRELSLSEAKIEIENYFLENNDEEIGYEELVETLRISPEIVVEACNELANEGKIG